MVKQSFRGTIQQGVFVPLAVKTFQNFIKSLESREITVTYIDYQIERTSAQNRLYWRYINILSNELGYTKDDMHEIIKHKFLAAEDVRTGLTVISSTTSLSTAEFNKFLSDLQLWASDKLNIYLPDPE